MNKYHYAAIGAVMVISVVAAAYFLQHAREFRGEFPEGIREKMPHSEKLVELRAQREDIRKLFEFSLLTEEDVEKAQEIAQSDDMTNAILQVLGEYRVESYMGPFGTAILRYFSEEWDLQVVVNLNTRTVESLSLNKGMPPLGPNPQKLVQIAQQNLPQKDFDKVHIGKVFQSGENAEVVLLTDKGTYTVTIDVKEGKVVDLKEEPARGLFWWPWPVLIVSGLLLFAIFLAIWKRRKSGKEEDTGEGKESEGGEGKESEGGEGKGGEEPTVAESGQ